MDFIGVIRKPVMRPIWKTPGRSAVGITEMFFSASIPCILSTDIPISVLEIIIIWFERTVLTVILTIPIAYLIL
jgi:nucleoside recognition membrane protein YjiH